MKQTKQCTVLFMKRKKNSSSLSWHEPVLSAYSLIQFTAKCLTWYEGVKMGCAFHTGRITKVFISHLHGDHLFGLPGLLCTVSLNTSPESQQDLNCVDIYGPRGLRHFLRVTLGITGSQLLFPYAGRSKAWWIDQAQHYDHLPDIPLAPVLLPKQPWPIVAQTPLDHSRCAVVASRC